ncbi:MAG: CorA family divalent cation transporter [Rivihabitans pingtungensis]
MDALRAAVKRGVRFGSPVDLLVHLLSGQADVLAQIVRDASQAVDAIEDRQLAERPRHSRAELASMRRVLVRLQRLLAPSRRRCFACLTAHRPGWTPTRCRACANPAKNLPWR